jgi:hypothetical protein
MINFTQYQPTPGLNIEQLRRMAPSIFASEAAPSRSEKYLFIPTFSVIEALMQVGYKPTFAQESTTKKAESVGYTKHMIRLYNPDQRMIKVGDTRSEIVLTNSHNGSSAYKLDLGLYRLICSNGMITKDESASNNVSFRHNPKITSEIIEGTARLIEKVPQIRTQIEEMQEIQLNTSEQHLFAEAALQVRFDDPEHPNQIHPASINAPRRRDDVGSNLWLTFNRIQEALIRGTPHAINAETGRRQTIREIKSVDGLRGINQGLWTLSQKMAELKR